MHDSSNFDVLFLPEPSPTSIPNETNRKVARKLVKYVYAKFILEEVHGVISEKCEGCQQDYLSQREHECMYYGGSTSGQKEAIMWNFEAAAKRVEMKLVEKAIRAMAAYCDVTLEDGYPFGLLDLDELLHLLAYRWADDPEECYDALSDTLTVYGMVVCNDIIEDITAATSSPPSKK